MLVSNMQLQIIEGLDDHVHSNDVRLGSRHFKCRCSPCECCES